MNSRISGSSHKHSYYPLFFDILDKLCIVIGGGTVAERKVSLLLDFGAMIRLISPRITKRLSKLTETDKIEVVRREYREGDLAGAALVFAATDQNEINTRVMKEAHARGIPINVVDDPAKCDFIVPSIVKKPPITIAISTSGALPLLSKKLRKEISNYITKDYVRYAEIVGKFRKFLIEKEKDKKTRKAIMAQVNKTDFEQLVRMDLRAIKKKFLNKQ